MWPLASATVLWFFVLSSCRRRASSCKSPLSRCFEAAVPVTVDDDVIQQLLKDTRNTTSEPNTTSIRIEPLVDSKGFCNRIYKVKNSEANNNSNDAAVKILKVYSSLARLRMSVSGFEIGEIDTQLGKLGLGPRILASSNLGILMECLDAPTLTEEDFHITTDNLDNSNNKLLLPAIAKSLAQLHSLVIHHHQEEDDNNPNNDLRQHHPNMLWSSLQVLLQLIKQDNETKKYHYYQRQVEWQQSHLEALTLTTVLGHGDCKPSNIMVVVDDGGDDDDDDDNGRLCDAKFIDLETAGCHYRAFDLAKLFRTSHRATVNESHQQLAFLRHYLNHLTAVESSRSTTTTTTTTPRLLQLESNLLVPMTWLEAAMFFEAMLSTSVDASKSQRASFEEMAQHRKQEYQKSCQSFLQDIDDYKKERERVVMAKPKT